MHGCEVFEDGLFQERGKENVMSISKLDILCYF